MENLRRSGQRVVVEVENEEYNERSEDQGPRRDSETGAASESKKTSLGLGRQDMTASEGKKEERLNVKHQELNV